MMIYSNYDGPCPSDFQTQPLILYIGTFFLTIMLLCSSVNAFGAAETQKQKQTIEKKKINDKLARELREVKKKYPLLAERLGLVYRPGFARIQSFCLGGIDPDCHDAIQESCLRGGGNPTSCLASANKTCCQPAKFKQ